MPQIITEKDYPIKKMWLVKPLFPIIMVIIGYLLYFILVPFLERSYIELGGALDVAEQTAYQTKMTFYLIIAAIIIPLYFIFIIFRRKMFHYSVEDNFLFLEQGILKKQQRHIPYGVIQNLFIKQDLFDRIFGIASLVIENASQGAGVLARKERQKKRIEMLGFSGNEVSIPGLANQDAEKLKQIILQKIKENPVKDTGAGL